MRVKLIVVIVNKNKGERVIEELSAYGMNYVHATLGVGTAPTSLSEIFATGETEKAVVLGTAEESAIPALWECLREHFAFEEKDTGIAFTVPLKSVGGPASLRILAGEAAEKKEKDKEKDSEGKK